MWNLKKRICKRTYLQNRNRLTDLENELMVTRGEGGGGGTDWEFGIDIFKIDNQQGLLYSTGNSTQYSVIT